MQNKNLILRKRFESVLRYYDLDKDSDLYKVVCPFHGDKNPSLQINKEQAFFYCYGCGVHGSSIELIKLFNPKINDFEAYNILYNIYNNNIYNNNSVSFVDTKIKIENYKEGVQLAKDFYCNLPNTNWYKVPEEVFEIKRYMLKRGFKTKTLKTANAKATYNVYYPIVFPLFDNGIFRGYVMRTDDPTVEDQRKYMYNKGFKRRVTLAGQYRTDTVILVEGFLDKLAGNQLGFQNIAAILGWKISSEQFQKLKRKNIKKIICALDNDDAGNKGYKYLKRICKINNIKLVRVRFPKGKKDFGDLLLDKTSADKVIQQLHQFGAT